MCNRTPSFNRPQRTKQMRFSSACLLKSRAFVSVHLSLTRPTFHSSMIRLHHSRHPFPPYGSIHSGSRVLCSASRRRRLGSSSSNGSRNTTLASLEVHATSHAVDSTDITTWRSGTSTRSLRWFQCSSLSRPSFSSPASSFSSTALITWWQKLYLCSSDFYSSSSLSPQSYRHCRGRAATTHPNHAYSSFSRMCSCTKHPPQ